MQLDKGRVVKYESFHSVNGQFLFHVRLLNGNIILCSLEKWLINFLMSSLQIDKPNFVIISEYITKYLKKRGHYVVVAENAIVGLTTNCQPIGLNVVNLNGNKCRLGYWLKNYLNALKALTFTRQNFSALASAHFSGCEAIVENGQIVGIIQNLPS